jgi:GT2 family glycosyltransferase
VSDKTSGVSVVLTTWNRREELRKTLMQLHKLSSSTKMELIVVDNCSSDGSVEMVRDEFPSVRLLAMPDSSYSPVEGMNIGFANALNPFIVALDDDSYPLEGALEEMLACFDSSAEVGAVAFKVVNPATGQLYTDDWPAHPLSFWGCAAGFRADVLRRVHYYDTDFFTYENEFDLAIRILDSGYLIKYLPQAVVHHWESPVNRSWGKTIFYGTRNRIWICIKHFPLYYMAIGLMRMLAKYCLIAIRRKAFLSFVRAMVAALGGAVKIVRKRRPVKKATIDRIFAWGREQSSTYSKPIFVCAKEELVRLFQR